MKHRAMPIRSIKITGVLTLFLVVILYSAGFGSGAAEAATEKIVKIGSIGPFTGPAARVGQEFKNAIEMAFDQIDWKIGDYKVQFVWIDSESDAEKAVKAYEKAIVRDKIDVGFNSWHTWVSASCMEVAAKYKLPHFFTFGAGKIIVEKYNSNPQKYKYWAGKAWPVPEKLSIGYVRALEDAIAKGLWKPKSRRVAVFGVDNDWGRSFGAAVKKQFTDAGWKVVTEEYVQMGETEFYPLLSKIKRKRVSVAVGSMSDPPSVSAFIKQSREVEVKCLILCDGLGWVGEWYSLTGDSSDYVLDQIPQWTTPAARKFRDDFKARFGFEPGASSGGLCYDSSMFLIKVLKTTLKEYGALTRENFVKCAEEQVMTGKLTLTEGLLMEEYKFTPETFPDPIVGKGYYIFPVIQYLAGKAKIIWPEEWKNADLQIPANMRE